MNFKKIYESALKESETFRPHGDSEEEDLEYRLEARSYYFLFKVKYEDGEVEWFRHQPNLVFSILGIPYETEEGLAKIDALIDGETIEDVDEDGRKFKMRIIREISFSDTYGPLEKVLTPEDYE